MKRKIVVTFEFQDKYLTICSFEILDKNLIEIHNQKALLKNWKTFIPTNLKAIEAKVGSPIKDITILVDNTNKLGGQIKVVKQAMSIDNKIVNHLHIEKLLKDIKTQYSNQEMTVVNLQPLKYYVNDIITKQYLQAPLGKSGKNLSILTSIALLKNEVIDFVNSITQTFNLNVLQILLKPQVISQNHLSNNALNQGAILLHVDDEHSYITINQDRASVKLMTFNHLGFKNLLQTIAAKFNCNLTKALELIMIYGDLNNLDQQLIHLIDDHHNSHFYSTNDLQKMIKQFLDQLVSLSQKYIVKQEGSALPIVLSGDITHIQGLKTYLSKYFKTLVLHKPLAYCELKKENQATIGLINYNRVVFEKMGKNMNTIVETNPNTFSSLKLHKKNRLFHLIAKRRGGKYEWN